MLPKRILNIDLSYLPKCTEYILENKNLLNLILDRFLYRGGLNWQILA